jgi:Flp pilus assembly secretin CpaC
MVIGGLIRETDNDQQSKVPLLGDLWLVGRLFQLHHTLRERKEYIITLIPHIVPGALARDDRHSVEVQRTQTRLLTNTMERIDRPWEPSLPDAVANPVRPCQVAHQKLHGDDEGHPTSEGAEAQTPYYGTASPGPGPAAPMPAPMPAPDASALRQPDAMRR